ncbi:1,4-dihydroxy-2-naphthoate polyprenyltransferase [Synoicihabitans lomoniglobus]|uniref:1,4-dihydroxy-2-naphthoate octaprenyltransferase n=1 Tax=Synoicihabitans lomoniglobus TaxID=2909285 RepID=A0AAF0CSF3_9BACT|nr:1,4-dihydroxy-2-naphthoate polyprenyltransferase [Opitutaceae bacterium LMO-M01]WED67188.1 1,4-dihydroxy-2-naphthoate polyprenyltransferase [Opitutaceae bacterium LMO-M01]
MSTGERASISLWWEAARPRTLPAAVAPVVLATALARHDGLMNLTAAGLCLAFALLIQIGTNYANDYYDFVKGADTAARVGPRRAVAAGLIAPATMQRAMMAVFATAFVVGLGLLPFGGWPLLVVGVVSILCGIAYTGGPYPLAYHGWGDVFVFVFFGLVAVVATYFVQAQRITSEAWILGAGIGALATNILVVNNYRDIATDRQAGKRTLAVRFGEGFSQIQFMAGHLVMIGAIGLLAGRGVLFAPVAGALMAFAGLQGVVQSRRLSSARGAPELIQLLGATGRHVALSALLVSVGLLF